MHRVCSTGRRPGAVCRRQ